MIELDKNEIKKDRSWIYRLLLALIIFSYPLYSVIQVANTMTTPNTQACYKIDNSEYYTDSETYKTGTEFYIVAKVNYTNKQLWERVTTPEYKAGKICKEISSFDNLKICTILVGICSLVVIGFFTVIFGAAAFMMAIQYVFTGKSDD